MTASLAPRLLGPIAPRLRVLCGRREERSWTKLRSLDASNRSSRHVIALACSGPTRPIEGHEQELNSSSLMVLAVRV